MSTLHQQIRADYRRLATRPVPAAWTFSHPSLRPYSTVADLVDAVRDYQRPADADQVVRALADLTPQDSVASTVLLEALSRAVRSRAGGNSSAEFRDDILVELTIVILEADDLDNLDDLPTRLVRRAHARARRGLHLEAATRAREPQLGEAELEIAHADDPAEIATNRAHLTETLAAIEGHVRTGRLSARAWEDCRDGCLAPSLGWWRLQPNRARTYRARRAVEAVLTHAS